MSDDPSQSWRPPNQPPSGPQQQWPQQPTQVPQGPWQQQPPQGGWPQQPQGPWQQAVGGGPPYPNQPPPRSRAPLIAGLAIVAIIVVLVIGLIAFIGSGLAPLLSRTALQDLTVGQCFNGARVPAASSSGIVLGVDVVACTEPHESELAATFDYPGGSPSLPYPGLETVSSYAESECIGHFADYVDLSFNSSVLGMTYIYPLEANWALDDYSIQCVVHPPDGQDLTSESFRNARR